MRIVFCDDDQKILELTQGTVLCVEKSFNYFLSQHTEILAIP